MAIGLKYFCLILYRKGVMTFGLDKYSLNEREGE
jgi:hypothetical protein